MPQKNKKKSKRVNEVTDGVKKFNISEPSFAIPSGIILDDVIKPEILEKWPKLKLKVPAIFLHKPAAFQHHVRKVLAMGIKFYFPLISRSYTKITCESFNDHKSLTQYFEKKQLPFHTYGHPIKRKMKVVIRGLPHDTDLIKLKVALKSLSIPIIRVHKMHVKEGKKQNFLVLAVVPYDEEGKKILKVIKIFGHDVKLEPPIVKAKQCYRCQKWGHSQRYCHGQIKCVKCAGEHPYKKCERDAETEPPKCANCGEEHTASYRQCVYCPDSPEHILTQTAKAKFSMGAPRKLQIFTIDHFNKMFKNLEEDCEL